ncbi:ABC transporter substrate-binding protein/permease [Rhodococcus sp. 1.20]
MRRRFDRPRNARWPILAILLALIAALFAPGIASAQPGRTYTIATDLTFAPFEFENEDGKLVGIDIDLLNAIAEDQGFKVDIKQLGFDAALQAVQAGQADGVIAGMSITDARKQVFDFSDPYFESGVQMAVLRDRQRREVVRGSEGQARRRQERHRGRQLRRVHQGPIRLHHSLFRRLRQHVRRGPHRELRRSLRRLPRPRLRHHTGQRPQDGHRKEVGASYGFAVNKGQNAELLQMFNAGLQNLRDDGQYDEIVSTYLGQGASTSDNSIIGLIKSTYPQLLKGLWLTIVLSVVSIAIALVLGAIFGLCRVSTNMFVRGIGTTYVDIFRGTPLLVQAFFIYFGIPAALHFQMSAFTAGIITLSLNAGAYMAEIVRGGILSVDKGQMEASRSLGISYMKSMRKVIMPQAIRTMIPSYINQFVITLKDTSILSVIGLAELTQTGRIIIARNFQSFNMWLIIGVMYFIIIMALTKLSNRLEKRINK